MTDRIHALTVVFDEPIHYDDAHEIMKAIQLIRGVLRVQPHVADVSDYVAKETAKSELWGKIREAFKDG